MKKKLIPILAAALTLASGTAFAADFTDVPSEHWAYPYVDRLVGEGTVNGKDDGIFAPDDSVTRAEYVKMIGALQDVSQSYSDVSEDFWGYSYITASGVDPDEDGNFRPDEAITRGDVINILWKRAGSPSGADAPYAARQSGEAAAWAYAANIMRGDGDGDQRLGDTITRAEVSKVICASMDAPEWGATAANGIEVIYSAQTTDPATGEAKTEYKVSKRPALKRTDSKPDYSYLIYGVSDTVYDTPYWLRNGLSFSMTPKEMLEAENSFPANFDDLFTLTAQNVASLIKKGSGAEFVMTYYPSMVRKTNASYVYRVKCELISDEILNLSDIFDLDEGEEDTELSKGSVFWADIESDYAFGMGVGASIDMEFALTE